MPLHDFKEGSPARQGFYRVKLKNGSQTFADWREHDKKEGKRWWTYVSDDPTVEKTRVALDGVVAYAKAEAEEIDLFLSRELTREERIEKAYRDYVANRPKPSAWLIDIPPSRRLQLGQDVRVGGFLEGRVAGLYEDDQLVVIEYYREVKGSGGKVAGTESSPSFSIYHWLDVLPRVETVAGLVRPRRLTQPESTGQIKHLVERLYKDDTKDDPDYQRDYAWTPADKDLYLDTFFNGRNLGRFVFVVYNRIGRIEVLDGKQRLHTLVEFMGSAISYRGTYWHQLSREDRQQLLTQTAQFVDLQSADYSRLDLLKIFKEVNAAGVPQTPEHLKRIDEKIAEEEAKLAAG